MQLLWRYRIPLALLAAYWVLALGLYLRWERENWFPPHGDEPRHLIIGRSIAHHQSLELTEAYRDEVAEGRLGRPGDEVRAGAFMHLRQGRSGLFTDHSIGTGLVAAPAILLSDALGYPNDVFFVKVLLVALSGSLVLAAWTLATVYAQRTVTRVLAVVVTCFALPPLVVASQVFPDLPGGIIIVCALAYAAWRQRHPNPPAWMDVAALATVAFLPFLHYKFAPEAVILGILLLYLARRSGAPARHLILASVIPAIAAALFFAYNIYAWGDPFFTASAVHTDHRVVQWFFILNLDRWHGFFIQNPIYVLGLFFLVPFILRQPAIGLASLGCYLAAIGINAAHASPGDSFAGRHAWTGCMALVPATIYALGRLESISPRIPQVICGALIALQASIIIPLYVERRNLYNQDPATWHDAYRSFYPSWVDPFLPAFVNGSWWNEYAINYLFGLIAVAIVVAGAALFVRETRRSATFGAGFFGLATVLVLLVGTFQSHPPRSPRSYYGSNLPRHFGIALPNAVKATTAAHDAGRWTFGPYINTAPGWYEVTFEYSSDAPPTTKVGTWDVTGRAGRVTFATGDLVGSDGLRAVATVQVRITSRHAGESLEARTYFLDTADVILSKVTVEPIKKP